MHVRTQSLLQAVLINKAKLMSAQFLRTVMIIHTIEDFRLSSVNKREVYCDISFFKVLSLISCFSGLNSSNFEFQGEDILCEDKPNCYKCSYYLQIGTISLRNSNK